MKLCFITREYPPLTPYSGGIGSQYAALAPELARQGHDVHVLSFVKRPRQFVQEGVAFHLAPFNFWHFNNLARALAVDQKLRPLGSFDVVYAAEWGGDAWRYSAHQRNGPLVTNLQISLAQVLALSSSIPGLGRLTPRVLITERLEREQAEQSTGVVGCSEAVLRWASDLWRLDRVPHRAVLPNTTNVRRVRTLARGDTAAGFPTNGPVVAFSGRLETRKGVAVLAKAMREVWRERPTAQLVLLGHDFPLKRGKMSDYVLETAGEFARNVHLLGNQAAQTLFPSLAAADVIALPSLWEAFGIAALEAMALGKAVVLTSGSGYDDFATHEYDALLIRPGMSHDLAQAILRLLGDPALRARLGSQAARTADRFDVPVVARAHGEYFAALRGFAAGSAMPVPSAAR
jgi:glycogen(starch) synthase